ncbi:MAG TPA: homocitrate synthase [Prosthecochloris aestuarii]|uniref:Homocitrate synthase n=1 Tax=Prosthecochloris aestuarii TaxID=1102 RepID=A0A831SS35_PROAE|nr:homocitrate synthase [Prosthecochloris aestuarii]
MLDPWIIDTTLRDGEQAPGVAFTPEEKQSIAIKLAECGVDELEIGYPAISSEEQRNIQRIVALNLPLRLTSWARAKQKDIECAAKCGTEAVHISFPLSDLYLQLMNKDFSWVEKELERLVKTAKHYFDIISVGGQDATRARPEMLEAFCLAAMNSGADRVRIADTVGVSTPLQISGTIRKLKTLLPVKLEFHAHNDLGMATANAFTAIEAGCDAVNVSANGLGERAGNAALEELAVALRLSGHLTCRIHTERLEDLCNTVARASGRPIQEQKPVTGASVFRHESGIHCNALIKNPLSYQPFLPEEIGRPPYELVIGKHSGSTAIQHALAQKGISIERNEAARLLEPVRITAARAKRNLSAEEVTEIYHHYRFREKNDVQHKTPSH